MRILYNSLEVPHVINTKLGELIYNKHDKVLYTKDKYMNILKIATGGGSGVNGKDGKDGRDGVSFDIKGTDTYANIINKPNPKKGDMWIASDRNGHGIVFNGLKWTDVGQITGDKGDKGDQGKNGVQGVTGAGGKSAYDVWLSQGNTGTVQDFFKALEGQQGVQGQKGIQGTGIHFKHAYATKADMIAANPTPQILGLTHLVLDTGDLWVWDNPNPPFDAAGAKWNDVGHIQGVQGNAGVQGIQGVPGHDGQPGVDGKDGDPLQLATPQETIAGTVTDKANTPEGTRAAYVPMTGGTYTGTVTIPTLVTTGHIKGIDQIGGTQDWFVGRAGTRVAFGNYKNAGRIGILDTGDIRLDPDAGMKVTVGTSEILTETTGIKVVKGAGHLSNKGTSAKVARIDSYIGTTRVGIMGYSENLDGMLMYNYKGGGNSIRVRDDGNIRLTTKHGKKATLNGKNILTGKLSGHTLHLDF